jgi:CHAD domain-containing protein
MAEVSMRRFAGKSLNDRLDVVAFEINRASKRTDEESVHRLRVAIRRFQQAVRIFEQYLPAPAVKKVRKQLRTVLKCAGQVRNFDIAQKLLERSGADTAFLRKERREAMRMLTAELRHVCRADASSKWRSALDLDVL